MSIPEITINPRIQSHLWPLRREELAGLEESILREGCRDSLVLWGSVLVDGHNRYEICRRHGIGFTTTPIEFGDIEEACDWVEENQWSRRNGTPDQFAYFIGRKYERMKKVRGGTGANQFTEQRSQNGTLAKTAEIIAMEHGLGRNTVLRNADYAANIDVIADTVGDNARTDLLSGHPGVTRADIAETADLLPEAKANGLSFGSAAEALAWAKEQRVIRGTQGTGDNEWFTPGEYIAAVREVMGAIDLDPATHSIAQQTVKATKFYTKEMDGLTKQWNGRVWLNPPYAQPYVAQFISKLVESVETGSVREAIALTHNYTDTTWFHEAAGGCAAICFTRGRIQFVDPDGKKASPTQGQAFFYFGEQVDRFAEVFNDFGFVMVRHE